MPHNAEKVLVVDPGTGQASSIDLPFSIAASKKNKFASVCRVNGKAVVAS